MLIVGKDIRGTEEKELIEKMAEVIESYENITELFNGSPESCSPVEETPLGKLEFLSILKTPNLKVALVTLGVPSIREILGDLVKDAQYHYASGGSNIIGFSNNTSLNIFSPKFAYTKHGYKFDAIVVDGNIDREILDDTLLPSLNIGGKIYSDNKL